MRPFRTRNTTYNRSTAIDGSTRGNTTVTVAVTADRTAELDILSGIYTAAEGYDFFPFRNKAHDIDYARSVDMLETIIESNQHRLKATAHITDDGSDPERIEAVQSAILVEELGLDDSLVLLDGNEDKAERFARATEGISDECPPLATCIKSELYYPTSLVADICASYLSHEITTRQDCYQVLPVTPPSKDDSYWGAAYGSMVQSSKTVETMAIERRRADTVSARVNCWYEGIMGGGEPVEYDTSVHQVVNYLQREGYDELAGYLSEV